MSIHLQPETEHRIQECMQQCGYPTPDEVVRAGIELLETRARNQKQDLEQVRRKIATGLEQLERGQGLDGEQVFEELLGELDRACETK